MNARAPNINRSDVYEPMVQRLSMLKLANADRTLFPTIRELLCFAALLGFSEGRRLKLDPKHRTHDISYQQFERAEARAEDLIYMIALAETEDTEVLREGEEGRCALIFEEYANGGLDVLQDVMNKSGGEWPDRDIIEFFQQNGYLNKQQSGADLTDLTF